MLAFEVIEHVIHFEKLLRCLKRRKEPITGCVAPGSWTDYVSRENRKSGAFMSLRRGQPLDETHSNKRQPVGGHLTEQELGACPSKTADPVFYISEKCLLSDKTLLSAEHGGSSL